MRSPLRLVPTRPQSMTPLVLTPDERRHAPDRVAALTADVLAWLAAMDRYEPYLVDWFCRRVVEWDAQRDRSREGGAQP